MTATRTRRPRAARSVPRRGRSLLHGAAALYAAFTVAALLAWTLVGDTWWSQPVNLTTFWWTLPALVVAPAVWSVGWRTLGALLAVPAVTWLWSYGAAFLPNGPAADADLRVLSFNTFVGTPGDDHVLALIEEHDPDVLLLQEVFPDRQRRLEERLADRYPGRVTVQSPGVGGVAVFSRYPVVDTRPVGDATERSRSTSVVVLDVGGQRVQVVPVHLISPCPTCGTSILERLDFEGEGRRAEMSGVVAALDPELPAIVGGDFNSNDRSQPYRRLVGAGFRDPQREVGSGMGFTWPNDGRIGPVLRIDWVLVRGLEPVAASVDHGGASDHRPVIVDLALQDG